MLPIVNRRNYLSGFMDDFFGNDWLNEKYPGEYVNAVPAVNIIEEKDEYRIEIAAPGMNKKDFRIDIENNNLIVSSEMKEKKEEDDQNYVRREFSYSSFRRSFSLPDTVKTEEIKAKHDNGILNIHIPKKKESVRKGPISINIT